MGSMLVTPSDYVIAYGVILFCFCMFVLGLVVVGKILSAGVRFIRKGRTNARSRI